MTYLDEAEASASMIDPEACSDVDQTFVSKQYSDCDIESDVYSGLDYFSESETSQGSYYMEIHTSDSEVSVAESVDFNRCSCRCQRCYL